MNTRLTGKGSGATRGRPIDFLGYCFTHGNVRLRKSIKQTFARKSKRIKNEDKRKQVLASYWGWCKWGQCRNLWNRLTDNDMGFAEKGVGKKPIMKDAKRVFDLEVKKVKHILNYSLIIRDFEPGIKTQNGPDRMAVIFSFEKTPDRHYKFITNSLSIKDTLTRARELERETGNPIFPVDKVRIVSRPLSDGKDAYQFEDIVDDEEENDNQNNSK